ncbi:MAG TPA: phosphatidylserine decarboxylase family protein [Blastocatellia bacterium]|nr:phosphatidylserine decarboxylase family protein [Blastocatellia bacterium]
MLHDAYPYVIPPALLGGLCLLLGWLVAPGFYVAAAVLLFLALFVAFFFRDPERESPGDERTVVSPADGLVVVVRPADPAESDGGTLISIFLSIFDVHVNRSPLAGQILKTEYRPGRFLIATKQRASIENEQNVVTVENRYVKVIFKQIAGLIARRIVFWKSNGDQVRLGERVGLIKFGSRVDVLLPPQVTVLVKKGDRVKGGTSIIGKVNQ